VPPPNNPNTLNPPFPTTRLAMPSSFELAVLTTMCALKGRKKSGLLAYQLRGTPPLSSCTPPPQLLLLLLLRPNQLPSPPLSKPPQPSAALASLLRRPPTTATSLLRSPALRRHGALVLLFFLLLLADVGGGDLPGTVIVDPLLAGAVDNRDEPLDITDGVRSPPTDNSRAPAGRHLRCLWRHASSRQVSSSRIRARGASGSTGRGGGLGAEQRGEALLFEMSAFVSDDAAAEGVLGGVAREFTRSYSVELGVSGFSELDGARGAGRWRIGGEACPLRQQRCG